MNQEQIESVREQLQKSFDAFAEPLDEMALAALDHLTKANEELRAEVELAKQEGVTETLQQIDCLTGGDGEYRLSTCPDRNCPDEDAMCKKIVARFDDLRATIDQLQTTIKAFNNGMPAMTTKEVADENADLRATIDRLTKERDGAWKSADRSQSELTDAIDDLDEAHTRLSAMQEAIDEAVRRADGDLSFSGYFLAGHITEPLRPFATKPEPEAETGPLVDKPCPLCKSPVTKETGFADNFGRGEYQYASCSECSYQADWHDHVAEFEVDPQPEPSTLPPGYGWLPDGMKCRCIKLWQDGKGNYACCRGYAGVAQSTHTEPEVDPLVAATQRLLQYEGHMVWCGHGKDDSKPCVCGLIDAQSKARDALAARGGRVVFDGREG